MADLLAPLLDALRQLLPAIDEATLRQVAATLMQSQQAEVGGNRVSITLGEGHTIDGSTISVGDVAGGNLTKTSITIHVTHPDPIAPLQQLLYHHESSTIFRNRLQGFVGREAEIADIRARIAQVMPTGGYVTITAQAGEGKSSVIARMVEQDGPEQTAFHFIALTPGREYQLGILRTLTARLTVKHGLSATYFPEQSYPAMRDFFSYILRQLSEQGIQDVIYVDGLDQLDPESNGVRDLSFLPTAPPPGIVFVLGTRPDDTLKPLEVMKPRHEYRLPHLSYADFQILLAHQQIVSGTSARLYAALGGNAFYLVLAVGALQSGPIADLDVFIQKISDNPDNLFGFTLDRLRNRDRVRWREVLLPALAILLVAQEPLGRATMRGLLDSEDGELRDGLAQLGGFVVQDGDGRYFLYHLKIRDYLQEDPAYPEKPFLFSHDQIVNWHARLAAWCVRDSSDIVRIWEDSSGVEQARRWYARHHYMRHLASGHQWDALWQAIDNGTYGRHKRRFDPSTQLYARDLDGARDVAVQSTDLINLWRASLLRVSLSSRVDRWPIPLFRSLIHLGRTSEALNRVELIADRVRKVHVLCSIVPLVDEKTQHLLWGRAHATIEALVDDRERVESLCTLAAAMVQVGDSDMSASFASVLRAAEAIGDAGQRTEAVCTIAEMMALAGWFVEVQAAVATIMDDGRQADRLRRITDALVQGGAFNAATTVAAAIRDPRQQAEALSRIAEALAENGNSTDARATAERIPDDWQRSATLRRIAEVLARTTQLEEACATVMTIQNAWQRAYALSRVAESIGHADRAGVVCQEWCKMISPAS